MPLCIINIPPIRSFYFIFCRSLPSLPLHLHLPWFFDFSIHLCDDDDDTIVFISVCFCNLISCTQLGVTFLFSLFCLCHHHHQTPTVDAFIKHINNTHKHYGKYTPHIRLVSPWHTLSIWLLFGEVDEALGLLERQTEKASKKKPQEATKSQ